MKESHVTRDLLGAFSRGELPSRLLLHLGLEHVAALCPTCREEIDAWRRERIASRDADAIEIPRASRAARERKAVERDFRALVKLPASKRAARIKRARSRFRGMALVELLLGESQKLFTSNPGEARHLAELARTVLHHSPQVSGYFDALALATACIANAARASGDLREAAEHFVYVRQVVSQQGVATPEVLARLDDLEGSLRKDQRFFPDAEALFRRAITLYRLVGASREEARVMINLGIAFDLQERAPEAIEVTQAALGLVSPEDDLRLYLCARFNVAWSLVTLGEYDEAERRIAEDYGLYCRLRERWTDLRLAWLRGRIAAGRGRVESAERELLHARDGFIEQGIGFDAAMVSVEELAPLYLREGRTAEVKRLAEEMLSIFTAADIHREALAALILFAEAAKREEVTIAMTEKIARYLRDARVDPSLRFREG